MSLTGRADNRAALAAATRQRADQTRARARAAIRRLDHDGATVTFTAVATAANTSRSLLYRDADIRAEIERLRARAASSPSRLPTAERTSDASVHQRLATLLDDNHALRDENRKLREHVVVLLGGQRAASTPSRNHAPTVGPCRADPHAGIGRLLVDGLGALEAVDDEEPADAG